MEILKIKRDKRIKEGLLKIGEIAGLAGLLPSCVRFYTQSGLLKVQATTQGGYWLYEKEKTLKTLLEIKDLIAKGLTLEDIIALRKRQGRIEKAPEVNQNKIRSKKLTTSGQAILIRHNILRKN